MAQQSFSKKICHELLLFEDYLHSCKTMPLQKDKIIVLLEIPQADKETIDNIYAVSFNGDILWQSESLKTRYPNQLNLPYEYMTVNNNEIQATDFYGRMYVIDAQLGHIKRREIVK